MNAIRQEILEDKLEGMAEETKKIYRVPVHMKKRI